MQTSNESTPHFDESPITKSEVAKFVKGIAVHTAQAQTEYWFGFSKMKHVIKYSPSSHQKMLYNTLVTTRFQKAKTVLICKGVDHNDPSYWRVITICPVLWRIIEHILERRLRNRTWATRLGNWDSTNYAMTMDNFTLLLILITYWSYWSHFNAIYTTIPTEFYIFSLFVLR